MSNEFAFNAPQYFDFRSEEDGPHDDSFFDIRDEAAARNCNQNGQMGEVVEKRDWLEADDDTIFFSPTAMTDQSTAMVFISGKLRKSLSTSHLPTASTSRINTDEVLSQEMSKLQVNKNNSRSGSSNSLSKSDHINRLAQPKRFRSEESLGKIEYLSMAEGMRNFQVKTPKRFRSHSAFEKESGPRALTKPQTPNLKATTRTRPVTALSREEQERMEFEEVKKFKIRANPVNKKILRGPLKAPAIEKKPATTVEPFQLTEVKKRDIVDAAVPRAPLFHAQPIPRSLHNPFKVQRSAQPVTSPCTPRFLKRNIVKPPSPKVENENNDSSKTFKPTRTQPVPFSFEKRDIQIMKKKEELIKKVFEEEKKAREFHARPLPKAILKVRNRSADQISEAYAESTRTNKSDEDRGPTFKARPAKVLTMEPFIPKRDSFHVIPVEEFHLNTDQRAEARQKFAQKIKEKELQIEQAKKQFEEAERRKEEEEVAMFRKQAEVKAQPIKKYKPVIIRPSNKVTTPVSPKISDKRRNKENIFE